ncbi:hypothetical protein ACQ859_10870 [Roseateles chitinivorans]|uniref:hypothetical protein n=1 Tax=Roseateles chitinivorans TaxID=2917965 RepID=UPI003D664562
MKNRIVIRTNALKSPESKLKELPTDVLKDVSGGGKTLEQYEDPGDGEGGGLTGPGRTKTRNEYHQPVDDDTSNADF